ncbi:MAG: ATP-binding cassette domain-containing protein [Acidobacteria bacterium]|nr:ATP-binding cassette domain-containing protein [Acidobacteriota bacterium]
MADPVITLRGVSKSFGTKPVLREANLEIFSGETMAILGGSGSGKTVTLKLINGLLAPDAGKITVLGHDVSSMLEHELIPLRLRVSYLFQGGALFDSMTIFDNVAFPIREHRSVSRAELTERVTELLQLVQLRDVEPLYPSELSGGMRKRAALARALALEPEIILYDEPTTGLDPVTGRTIGDLIGSLHRRLAVTSVIVTHEIPFVTRVAERIVFLNEGRFVYSGSPRRAASEGPELVREFFVAGGAYAG